MAQKSHLERTQRLCEIDQRCRIYARPVYAAPGRFRILLLAIVPRRARERGKGRVWHNGSQRRTFSYGRKLDRAREAIILIASGHAIARRRHRRCRSHRHFSGPLSRVTRRAIYRRIEERAARPKWLSMAVQNRIRLPPRARYTWAIDCSVEKASRIGLYATCVQQLAGRAITIGGARVHSPVMKVSASVPPLCRAARINCPSHATC